MKEIYELENFKDLSVDINKPLNKTHRIKVSITFEVNSYQKDVYS